MGPVQDSMTDIERETSFVTYIEDFFRPWYKSVEGNTDCTDYQIDGEDPILEVESHRSVQRNTRIILQRFPGDR